MSIRGRSIFGAIAFFGGLLLITGAGVSKSSARIDYERAVESKRAEPGRPPSGAFANVLMVLGGLTAIGGMVVIGFAARDMVAQIGQSSAAAEQRLQRELLEKRDPGPKP